MKLFFIKNLYERVKILVSLLISKSFIDLKTTYFFNDIRIMTLKQEKYLGPETSTIGGHCLAAYYAQCCAIVATAGKTSQILEHDRRS